MEQSKRAAVIVAHPDDETLWAGGAILGHPELNWKVVTLCRAADPDRAPRFFRVLQHLGASGAMANLDDGPEQAPLDPALVQETILSLLTEPRFDLVLTHGPRGEYTRHRRHEETCRAVVDLWLAGALSTQALWLFAYEDGGRQYPPRPEPGATRAETLPAAIWQDKHRLITKVYGFAPESWEAAATPRAEAFWCFASATDAEAWVRARSPQA